MTTLSASSTGRLPARTAYTAMRPMDWCCSGMESAPAASMQMAAAVRPKREGAASKQSIAVRFTSPCATLHAATPRFFAFSNRGRCRSPLSWINFFFWG